MNREYNKPVVYKYKWFPEKCDLCGKWFFITYHFHPVIKTKNQLDNLILCSPCAKEVFNDEVVQMAERSVEESQDEKEINS